MTRLMTDALVGAVLLTVHLFSLAPLAVPRYALAFTHMHDMRVIFIRILAG
jgi:hypothetical protein